MTITWTTLPLEMSVTNVDLTTAEEVVVSFRQGQVAQNYRNGDPELSISSDGTDSTLVVTLDQRASGAFQAGSTIEAQVNWILDGVRDASDIETTSFEKNLFKKVIA